MTSRNADVSLRGLPRSRRGVLGYFPTQVKLLHPVVQLLLNFVRFHVHLFSVHLDIRHGWCRYVSPFATNNDLFMQFALQAGFSSLRCSWPQGYYSPWFSSYASVFRHTQHVRLRPSRHSTQIIMFSDLECDYINPIDLCNKLNQVRFSLSF